MVSKGLLYLAEMTVWTCKVNAECVPPCSIVTSETNCLVPGAIGSALGLVGMVSAFDDRER